MLASWAAPIALPVLNPPKFMTFLHALFLEQARNGPCRAAAAAASPALPRPAAESALRLACRGRLVLTTPVRTALHCTALHCTALRFAYPSLVGVSIHAGRSAPRGTVPPHAAMERCSQSIIVASESKRLLTAFVINAIPILRPFRWMVRATWVGSVGPAGWQRAIVRPSAV